MNSKNTINLKPSIKLFIIACILSIILGVFFHFIYNLLNKPFIVGLFFPVNESIWEHLKLVLLPLTIFGINYSFITRKKNKSLNNFWFYTGIAIILSMVIIPVTHYSYRAIFKIVPDFINIIIYIISIIISFYYLYINLSKEYINPSSKNKNNIGITMIASLFLLFIIFTIYPPRLELFKDPITQTFGIFLL